MAVTRCPRCGSKITPKHRFCQECAFPVWEIEHMSDHITNNPVPFRLSDGQRRTYAASNVNKASEEQVKKTADERTEQSSGRVKKGFALVGLIVALNLLVAVLSFGGCGGRSREMPVRQSGSTQTIDIPILKTGDELHDIFLKLADSNIEYIKETEGAYEYENPKEEKIKRFCRSETAPPEVVETMDISETGLAVQAWYDDTDGAIYWYADVETVRLNENTARLFKEFTSLIEVDFSGMDTGNVMDMSAMFYECNSLTNLDLSSFDTGNVKNMGWMFDDCSSLASLDVSSFNTGNVTNMEAMFADCSSLTSLNVSSFDTGNMTDMNFMFDDCSSLTSLDVSSFDTGNVTDMLYMFHGCSILTSLDVSSFDTSNVTNMIGMFRDCSSLTSLDVSSFDTGNVTDMCYIFCGCSSLTSLDVSSFDTRNVTNMERMFADCSSLTSLDLSSFDTGNVTDMSYMFTRCSSLTKPKTTDAKIINEYENKL